MKDMKDMPAIPDLFYSAEWKGWDDFLSSQYPYDWELVEIIQFNYNGQGDAIALCDRRTTFVHSVDLNNILFGTQAGASHYDVVATDGEAKESLVTAPKAKTKAKPKKSKKSSNNVRKRKTKSKA